MSTSPGPPLWHPAAWPLYSINFCSPVRLSGRAADGHRDQVHIARVKAGDGIMEVHGYPAARLAAMRRMSCSLPKKGRVWHMSLFGNNLVRTPREVMDELLGMNTAA